eukprot:CAMPEP_0202347652 /NCGR_PEP_ID=MMETSP1126-20121109/5922_1 /ASSEMBLY_ACC=CAM_ASM_000457 /TAXON_ID=3047 /ORGANISM="Dunaliella tertiolecta, Strain CCMP1320" /LENGTH=466 /DNA_ID=CAMNT_0048939233 /DNA_START=314 /DNA_END=1714 /DNA_ORIENTATION=+
MTEDSRKEGAPDTASDRVRTGQEEHENCAHQGKGQAAGSEDGEARGEETEEDQERGDVGSSDGMPVVENHQSPDTVQHPGQASGGTSPELNIANPSKAASSIIRVDSPTRVRRDHLNNLSLLRPHTCPAQGSTKIRGPMKTLHLLGPSPSGTADSTLRKKDGGWPHSTVPRSQSPKRSLRAQQCGIPGYLATPGEQYATPPALILRSHSGTVEGQLQYQLGKVAPLGPAYSSAWVCDPPQRPLVSDFRLQPSQRSHTCYSPELVLRSVCLGGWAAPQRTRPGTAQIPAVSSTSPPAASVAGGGAARPQTAPTVHGHLHCSSSRRPVLGSYRPSMNRGTGLAFGARAAGKALGFRSPGRLQQEEHKERPWTSQSYCEGIRKGLPPSPATEFIRATAKSSFRAIAPNAPRLRQACEGIVLAQSQSRRARIEDPKLAPVPPIEVAQCNSMLHCNEDSPRLRYKQRLMYK